MGVFVAAGVLVGVDVVVGVLVLALVGVAVGAAPQSQYVGASALHVTLVEPAPLNDSGLESAESALVNPVPSSMHHWLTSDPDTGIPAASCAISPAERARL